MNTTELLAGVAQHRCRTSRLEMAYLEVGSGDMPIVLVHGNCSSALFFQDLMLALAKDKRYRIYAPDMRGFGDSETLAVDATRGVRNFSDDLEAFTIALDLPAFHLFGWSLGGNIALQYAIDHPDMLRSLMLQAPGSPYGFGGVQGTDGRPNYPDFAGSGGGTVNAEFVQRIAQGDRGSEQSSPRSIMNTFYFKPPFRAAPDREEIYVTSLLSTKTGLGNYPGDFTTSENWPNVAPGTQGVINALAPKYLNQSNFANIEEKMPVLWLHGADDQIVSDTSFFDIGFLGQLGAVPGWPGADVFPPQPMKTQVRTVLDEYRANGGEYREVMLADCGHSPHIEKQDEVVQLLGEFMEAVPAT